MVPALNRYNSGSPCTERTTGGDYGPDVVARMEWLAAHFPAPSPTAAVKRPKEVRMFIWYDANGVGFLWTGTKSVVLTGDDKEAMKTAGVPEVLGARSADLATALKG